MIRYLDEPEVCGTSLPRAGRRDLGQCALVRVQNGGEMCLNISLLAFMNTGDSGRRVLRACAFRKQHAKRKTFRAAMSAKELLIADVPLRRTQKSNVLDLRSIFVPQTLCTVHACAMSYYVHRRSTHQNSRPATALSSCTSARQMQRRQLIAKRCPRHACNTRRSRQRPSRTRPSAQ